MVAWTLAGCHTSTSFRYLGMRGDTNAGNDSHSPGEVPPSLQRDVPPVDCQWAQKLVQESNNVLEAHQKQVRTLEEYLARSHGLYVHRVSKESFCMFVCLYVCLFVCYRRGASREIDCEETGYLKSVLPNRQRYCGSLQRRMRRCLARALQLQQDVAVAQDELRAVCVCERNRTQRLALLLEVMVINLVQTDNGEFEGNGYVLLESSERTWHASERLPVPSSIYF